MPSDSIAQQRMFGMAHAVRKGELKKSAVNKAVKKIVDSDMTDKEIKDFAKTKHKGLPEYVKENMLGESAMDKASIMQYVGSFIRNGVFSGSRQIEHWENKVEIVFQAIMEELENEIVWARKEKREDELELQDLIENLEKCFKLFGFRK